MTSTYVLVVQYISAIWTGSNYKLFGAKSAELGAERTRGIKVGRLLFLHCNLSQFPKLNFTQCGRKKPELMYKFTIAYQVLLLVLLNVWRPEQLTCQVVLRPRVLAQWQLVICHQNCPPCE